MNAEWLLSCLSEVSGPGWVAMGELPQGLMGL